MDQAEVAPELLLLLDQVLVHGVVGGEPADVIVGEVAAAKLLPAVAKKLGFFAKCSKGYI